VVLSYHSLEDRAAKRAMRDGTLRGASDPRARQRDAYGDYVAPRPFRPVGRATRAAEEEVAANPRARSAVLRVAVRL
jgi:16S rRNA (cytosine1402-N4)-methyltransferase